MDGAIELAKSAAETLVQAMTTDGWAATRDRVAALFGRGKRTAAAELERSRAEVLDDPQLTGEVVAEWRPKLRRLIVDEPAVAAELRALLREIAPPHQVSADNTVEADVSGTSVQAATVGDVCTYGGDHTDIDINSPNHGTVIGKSVPPQRDE